MNAFYDRFDRHEAGAGLKGRSTHYCAGCGHGLVHKYVADAIEKLQIQDRTVAISPVGCAVFLHYYIDVGHIQAAHGRAPAVALGVKLAHPESIVVSYQGDGDLASIGLAEIVHAAQLGVPITVVFVNNAIYGMTGGQMAPTTLIGQTTTTSPEGRHRTMGEPLRMAELIAGLDGPVYVERVALYDNKQRIRARKAVEHALRLQVDNLGFAFVEILSECPLHLALTPREAERWVKDKMLPAFPLGVKKDATAQMRPWATPTVPIFDPALVYAAIGGSTDAPRHVENRAAAGDRRGIALKLAGAGGDGAQTLGLIVARAAINEGFDATCIPSYGPQSRGGTSYADVRIGATEILSPTVAEPEALVAFNGPSLIRFADTLRSGSMVVYDSSVVRDPPPMECSRLIAVPMSQIARDLGDPMVKNLVALGALAATHVLPEAALLTAMRQVLGQRGERGDLHERAFQAGACFGLQDVRVGPAPARRN
jgi:2-oxoisovalerate ferredoxin oxidoreductase beta subunit